MKYLGLDIGTTTISAAVMECSGGDIRNAKALDCLTADNAGAIPAADPCLRLQDPEKILDTAGFLLETLLLVHPGIAAIGVTGQQHGILYTDGSGDAVSPLFTWQDRCGDKACHDGLSYSEYLGRLSGRMQPSGYGNVTCFYHLQNGLVPGNARSYCTIPDYVAMKLTGRPEPSCDPSMLQSLGLFDAASNSFMTDVMERAGMDVSLLPAFAESPVIGTWREIPLTAAIGDNQASFYGSAFGDTNGILVNVGTGSQISLFSKDYMECAGLETRPFPSGGYLLVGASLCGGSAYALLRDFFMETASMFGIRDADWYQCMSDYMNAHACPDNVPVFDTRFSGTRLDPDLKGSITGLDTDNFKPLHFLYGMLDGISGELHGMYSAFSAAQNKKSPDIPRTLYGSGNGLRKNPYLVKSFENRFGLPLKLSQFKEEAASGAALYAALHSCRRAERDPERYA